MRLRTISGMPGGRFGGLRFGGGRSKSERIATFGLTQRLGGVSFDRVELLRSVSLAMWGFYHDSDC